MQPPCLSPAAALHLPYAYTIRGIFSSHLSCPGCSHEHPLEACKQMQTPRCFWAFWTHGRHASPHLALRSLFLCHDYDLHFQWFLFTRPSKGKQFVCPLSLLSGAWCSVVLMALQAQLSGGPKRSHNTVYFQLVLLAGGRDAALQIPTSLMSAECESPNRNFPGNATFMIFSLGFIQVTRIYSINPVLIFFFWIFAGFLSELLELRPLHWVQLPFYKMTLLYRVFKNIQLRIYVNSNFCFL